MGEGSKAALAAYDYLLMNPVEETEAQDEEQAA
jgi:hypothetical protein